MPEDVKLEDLFKTEEETPLGIEEDVNFTDPPPRTIAEHEVFNLICADCGGSLMLKPSKYGAFYGCENYYTTGCKGSLGADIDGTPRGTPGNKETRLARIRAHKVFDRLWEQVNGKARMTRPEAYAWMRDAMKLSNVDGHIGKFSVEQCNQLIKLVMETYPGVQNVWDRLLNPAF